MNSSTHQPQKKPVSTIDAGKHNSNIPGRESATNDVPDSLWSNILYGLGMTAVIVIPPLIPSASVRLLIMGYMFLILSIYVAAALASAMETFGYKKAAKRRRGKTNAS